MLVEFAMESLRGPPQPCPAALSTELAVHDRVHDRPSQTGGVLNVAKKGEGKSVAALSHARLVAACSSTLRPAALLRPVRLDQGCSRLRESITSGSASRDLGYATAKHLNTEAPWKRTEDDASFADKWKASGLHQVPRLPRQ